MQRWSDHGAGSVAPACMIAEGKVEGWVARPVPWTGRRRGISLTYPDQVTSTVPSPPETVQDALIEGLDRWRDLPAAQQPEWPDREALAAATAELATYPPLVFAGECDDLKARIAEASRGEAFLLQGGDCAETFADASADNIRNKIKTMLQMAVVLTYGARAR